ncbi:PVC-type heme-binding CxxCH protein [Aureliella helgolandensis]|uniref:Cytochrome c n=1 Tax=Aureliella helgolandensis TaxID=2527968 RepID=A0A518G0B7_9BACT|nr:PVC-type heme-binding CxxCH protein [Aureliella helgolandensis]QDV22057.1 Cytochrome c [Aureliella helgolandensis]
MRIMIPLCSLVLSCLSIPSAMAAEDRIVFNPGNGADHPKHVVLIAGDEEYRTEETMPMLGKILSQHHGFKCTVLFSMSEDNVSYIDPNNSTGLKGLDALQDADLMIIGTRFRTPDAKGSQFVTQYLNEGKPVLGIRTATHAFNGKGSFGGIPFADFGLQVLGETWVNHHGKHKVEGARSVVEKGQANHPILRGVGEIFCPSDVYGVKHLTDDDQILLRAAVTESLDPRSPNVEGAKNDPMQAFAWLHSYQKPNGSGQGNAFCATGGAAVDFADEDLRRLVVNAALHLTGRDVPAHSNVAFVDPFDPSFYGFIREPANYWEKRDLQPADFGLGKATVAVDPANSPAWKFVETASDSPSSSSSLPFEFRDQERIAFVGGSLAERMNLFGYFESLLHTRFPEKELIVRNFGWPADEVGNQQRPDNYTEIDNPMDEFGPELFLCFFGFNEHFRGDSASEIEQFQTQYGQWIERYKQKYSKAGREARFILVSPIAFEATDKATLPDGESNNRSLEKYSAAVRDLAQQLDLPYIELFQPTKVAFAEEAGAQYTINGVHSNEQGDRLIAAELDKQLFQTPHPVGMDVSTFHRIREAVNDKSWLHLQDYRMLNGWYVYGGRRTWDTETFPGEYQKIRKMVAVRDRYIWDLAEGKDVPEIPDDSETGEVFIPETMFGTRDEGFRKWREPKTLEYPTPEESMAQMNVPEGFEIQLFASEADFPEFSNPTQMTFDTQGRLWVSCMVNYPQWLPGSAKPGDKILIFEDTDKDGRADVCKTFYDRLICPTGFEFHEDGVLVVDEPRIIFLRDTDGDDQADEVNYLIDGIATDDTHHAMGAWEWSHGGLLYMLEGVSMSTTLETPWGPFRNKGPSGAYVFDPQSWKFRHFRTPGYGNPWCMVFDRWGMGIIGDGTNAQQHWTSPLSGFAVPSRKTLRPIFDNEGMRPAVGNDFLYSRHFPDSVQGQFIYACVINMHGMPRFDVGDEADTAGFAGQRVDDLLSSTDMFFRPVDPQIGPDGALWFGDWCNALIGHMQYSQRDPNRDHQHGRLYRMVYKDKPLLEPTLQAGKSIEELLEQLTAYETRTRYRARRELRARESSEVLSAVKQWIQDPNTSANQLCEAMWLQESFRQLDPTLIDRIMSSSDFHARAAAVHSVGNEIERYPAALDLFKRAIRDEHPRVRLETIRGLSYIPTSESAEVALQVLAMPTDYWIDYTLEHTLQALKPSIDAAEDQGTFLANSGEEVKQFYQDYKLSTGPGGQAVKPLKEAEDTELSQRRREAAIRTLSGIRGGDSKRGSVVFDRVCAACHQIGDKGKAFGPRLDDVGARYSREHIIRNVLWPNDTIAKGYETVQLLTIDGEVISGFILSETEDSLTLGVATGDGKGKEETIAKEDIEIRKEMKASSMPEGLVKTIAPSEFLDLIEYLSDQNQYVVHEDGWIETGAADVGELRKHGEFIEISRDAQLQLGANFSTNWTKYSNLVLSAVDPNQREFAFHSPNQDTQSPAIGIRLSAPAEIRHIDIQNRRNPQFYERAKDLAVWVSDDGKAWKQVWKSEMPAGEYSIDLPAGTRGKYLKVGLDGKGIFHLNQIVVFGSR